MKAEDIYDKIESGIRKLNKNEKIKLYSKIISESHPAFRTRKRGRLRKYEEAKRKLNKEFSWALAEERA